MKRRLLILTILTLGAPYVALAAAPTNFKDLVKLLVNLINTASIVAISFAVVVYFWGLATNIVKFADDPEKRKAYLFWGIIIFFVMSAIWGLVNILTNTFF